MRRPTLLDAYGRAAPRASVRVSPYEGAATGPRFAGFYAPNVGVNAALLGSLTTLRARCRALVMNDAFVWKGINALVANLVGTGIVPHSLVPNETTRDAIEAAWLVSTDEMPVDERDTYAQQATAVRSYLIDGEVLARRRPRQPGDGFYVPLQVQLLEADHLPLELNETRANGNVIRAGIEFNPFGQRVAYHLYRDHPADALFGSPANVTTIRVDAADIAHLYRIDRPGQLRGEPLLGRVILSSHDTAAFDDATLQLMTVASCFTAFRTRSLNEFGAPGAADELASPTEPGALELGPATVVDLDPGDDIRTADPPTVGAMYADYKKQLHLRNAAGMNCTYEDATGDHGDATFSSMRGARIDFRRWARQQVYGVIVPAFCRLTWRWWMDAAVGAGVLRLPGYRQGWRAYQALEWRPEGFDPIQPREDVEANVAAIAANLKSPQEVIRQAGEDPRRVQRELVEWRAWERDNGLSSATAPAPAQPPVEPVPARRRREAARA